MLNLAYRIGLYTFRTAGAEDVGNPNQQYECLWAFPAYRREERHTKSRNQRYERLLAFPGYERHLGIPRSVPATVQDCLNHGNHRRGGRGGKYGWDMVYRGIQVYVYACIHSEKRTARRSVPATVQDCLNRRRRGGRGLNAHNITQPTKQTEIVYTHHTYGGVSIAAISLGN